MPARSDKSNQRYRPSIELRPPRAIPGSRFLVYGRGWRFCPVELRLDGERLTPVKVLVGEPRSGRVRADARGEFLVAVVAPDAIEPGGHAVSAHARERDETLESKAELEVPKPQRPKADVVLDKPRERGRQFLLRRFGPADRLLPGARRLAWTHLQDWKRRLELKLDPDLPGAPFLPGCNWTPVGASVVPNGQITETTTTALRAPVSGRVTSLAVDPNDPVNTIYAGAAQGGVWKTTDGGSTWRPMSDFEFSLAIGALAIDPLITDPVTGRSNRIWAGTGEANFSIDSYYGGGLLRSDDGGETWTQVGAATFAQDEISRIIVDPADSTHLYVACSIGVFESTNSGGGWNQLRAGIANDLVLDASGASDILYAAFAGEGIFRRTGTGAWTLLTDPDVPNPAPGRVAVAACAGTPQTLYAAFENGDAQGTLEGIYQSTNGGTDWTPVGTPAGASQCWYNFVLAVHPTNANTVYFGEVELWRSTNGGTNWTRISRGSGGQPGIHADQHAFAFDTATPATVWAGNDGGVWRSTDSGTNWTHRNTGLQTLQYFFLAQHPQWEGVMLAGAQDNGAQRYEGHPAWTLAALGDGGYALIDPTTPTRWYEGRFSARNTGSATSFMFGCFRSDSSGAPGTFNVKNTGITVSDRVLFYAPITLDPSNPSTLYYGTHRLYRSTNNADNWNSITGDLTAANQNWRAISAITVAPSNSNIVYVGTSDGRLWLVQWNGTTWTTTNRSAGLPGVWIADIAVDPGDPNMVYVAVSALLRAEWATEFGIAHVWRSPDAGQNWTNISGGLNNANPVNSIAIDPANSNRIFIGADVGVFRSENQGDAWVPWDQGLPNVAVIDVKAHGPSRLLRVATHGRGVWERPIDTLLCDPVDIYMRDDIVDVGRRIPAPSGVTDPFQPAQTVYWYQSVDIKVDTADASGYQTPTADIDYVDFQTIDHRNPFRNATSRVYAQVHNRGVNTTTNVSVRAFWANAHGGLPDLPSDFWTVYPSADPADTSVWHPVGPAQTIAELRPAEPEIVEWDWPVPGDAPDHTCMLAVISCTDDPVTETGLDVDVIVPGNKHITLKNLHVDGPTGPGTARGPYFIDFATGYKDRLFDLVIRPERLPPGARLWFLATPYRLAGDNRHALTGIEIAKTGKRSRPERPDEQCGEPTAYDPALVHVVDSDREVASLRGIIAQPGEKFSIALYLDLKTPLRPGQTANFHVQQYNQGRLVGGSAYEVRGGGTGSGGRKLTGRRRATRAAKKTTRKKAAAQKKTTRKKTTTKKAAVKKKATRKKTSTKTARKTVAKKKTATKKTARKKASKKSSGRRRR